MSDLVEIDLPRASPLRYCVQRTLEMIDRCHTVPKSVPLQVTLMRGRSRLARAEGCYISKVTGSLIELNPKALEPHLTFAHEVGHFLDNRILQPMRESWASHYDVDCETFLATCFQSSSSRMVRRKLNRSHSRLSRRDLTDLRETQLPREFFARAYVQWLTVKSKSPILQDELQRRLEKPVVIGAVPFVFQWVYDDFLDIMHSVDQLFRKKGLL